MTTQMTLTEDQQKILNGSEGEGKALCLKTLVKYGEAFGAKRLVPIKSCHLAGSFKIFFYHGYYELVERLVNEGVKVSVPTTLNPHPGNDFTPQNRIVFHKQKQHEENLRKLGVQSNYSCVCYAQTNEPAFGDVLGWAESSAIIYANSAIGARSNRHAIMIDVCQGVTGLTPEFGFLFDEQRKGQIYFDLQIDEMDAPALGYLIGDIAVDKVPVLSHYPFDKTELKNMGAAMAASGAVTMFHVIGTTPEAPDFETAFGGREPERTVTITQKDLESIRAAKPVQQDAYGVAIGCPQMTYEEFMEIAPHFSGKKIKKRTMLHVLPDAMERFLDTPEYQGVIDSGAEVYPHCPLAALSLRIGVGKKDILTPSGKLYYYLQGSRYSNLEDVLKVCGVVD